MYLQDGHEEHASFNSYLDLEPLPDLDGNKVEGKPGRPGEHGEEEACGQEDVGQGMTTLPEDPTTDKEVEREEVHVENRVRCSGSQQVEPLRSEEYARVGGVARSRVDEQVDLARIRGKSGHGVEQQVWKEAEGRTKELDGVLPVGQQDHHSPQGHRVECGRHVDQAQLRTKEEVLARLRVARNRRHCWSQRVRVCGISEQGEEIAKHRIVPTGQVSRGSCSITGVRGTPVQSECSSRASEIGRFGVDDNRDLCRRPGDISPLARRRFPETKIWFLYNHLCFFETVSKISQGSSLPASDTAAQLLEPGSRLHHLWHYARFPLPPVVGVLEMVNCLESGRYCTGGARSPCDIRRHAPSSCIRRSHLQTAKHNCVANIHSLSEKAIRSLVERLYPKQEKRGDAPPAAPREDLQKYSYNLEREPRVR